MRLDLTPGRLSNVFIIYLVLEYWLLRPRFQGNAVESR